MLKIRKLLITIVDIFFDNKFKHLQEIIVDTKL